MISQRSIILVGLVIFISLQFVNAKQNLNPILQRFESSHEQNHDYDIKTSYQLPMTNLYRKWLLSKELEQLTANNNKKERLKWLDNNVNDNDDNEKSNEDSTEIESLPIPLAFTGEFKDLSTKKDANFHQNRYMSLCHFKICNMGRKRNSRYSRY